MTSDLLPELGSLADDVAYVHSLPVKPIPTAQVRLTCRPDLSFALLHGAWRTCALGTENQDLPAFTIPDPRGNPQASKQLVHCRLAQFQGTPFSDPKRFKPRSPGKIPRSGS